MANTLGTYGTANAVTATTAAAFIPEQWSDEVVAGYKRELVMAGLVRKLNHRGKKGDTIHIPMPTRGVASKKLPNQDVTIQQDTTNTVSILLDQHYEYSDLFEDFAALQALASNRQFVTDDAGFALASRIDTDLIQLARSSNNGAGTAAYATAYIAGDGNTLYTGANQTAITSAGLRRLVQRLDDNAVPMSGRFLLLPPVGRSVMMGITEYTAESFVGERGRDNTIRNGRIGDVYGIPVYVTPNCDTATGGARMGIIGHRDAFVLAEQQGVRVQQQYKQEKLATLFTADAVYGVKNLRTGADVDVPAASFAIAMTA